MMPLHSIWILDVLDVLLVATDALGAWMVSRHEAGTPAWDILADLDVHAFKDLVSALRASNELVNDDVTLLVVHLASAAACPQGGPA